MNNKDYNRQFDNIKCSPEFKAKMENLLSGEPDSVYADSVSNVEKAPKVNFSRWSALAASAFLALGIGGGIFLNMKNDPESSSGTHNIPKLDGEMRVSIEPGDPDNFLAETLDLGVIPDDMAKSIYELILDPATEAPEGWNVGESEACISIEYSDHVYKIDDLGNCSSTYSDGETYTGNAYDYYDIIEILAEGIFDCDWTAVYPEDCGERGQLLQDVFTKYKDVITLSDKPEELDTDDVFGIMNRGPFLIKVYKDGTISTSYQTIDEYKTIYHTSDHEVYKELAAAMEQDQFAYEKADENADLEVYELLNRNITDDLMDIGYSAGTGQNDDFETLVDYNVGQLSFDLKLMTWYRAGDSFPTGDFYIIGNIMVTPRGEIYDTETGCLYRISEDCEYMNTSIWYDVEPITLDEVCLILEDEQENFISFDGSVSINFSAYDDNSKIIGGTGNIWYNNQTLDEYFILKSDDDSYSNEYYSTDKSWVNIRHGEKLAVSDDMDYSVDENGIEKTVESGDDLRDKPYASYDTIKSIAAGCLRVAMADSEGTVIDICSKTGDSIAVSLSYIENGTSIVDFSLRLDENNIIRCLNVVKKDAEGDNIIIDYTLQVGYNVNSEDFEIPEPSQEMADEIMLRINNG